MKIYYSSKFYRKYKKLSPRTKSLAEAKEKIFKKNPHDIRLKTHALSGELKGFWSFSVDQKIRIIFEFHTKNVIWFHSVGTHDIYRSTT